MVYWNRLKMGEGNFRSERSIELPSQKVIGGVAHRRWKLTNVLWHVDTRKYKQSSQVSLSNFLQLKFECKTLKIRKQIRVYGGCLGSQRRGRTWLPAKSCGEVVITFDPQISEWGNPIRWRRITERRKPGELKHLSTRRRRKQVSDSVSSGERKRNSLNHFDHG